MKLPAWNIETEYPNLTSTEFKTDETQALQMIAEINTLTASIRSQLSETSLETSSIATLQKILILGAEAQILISNMHAYVGCLLSVDAKDEVAKSKASRIEQMAAEGSQAIKPAHLFVSHCESATFEKIISHQNLQSARFQFEEERSLKPFLLSEKEETLLSALSPSGHSAWGDLYSTIAGTARVRLERNGETEEIGLAQAAGMTRSRSEQERKISWQGVQQAWKENEESVASILNSLAGWRLEVCKKRSHTKPNDFMHRPLFDNRIEEATLNAMLTAVEQNKAEIQKAALLMAQMHGKKKLDPWDLLAPAPIETASAQTEFSEAIRQIRTAFGNVNPQFGEFVDMMVKNQWIEARVLPNKGAGAHCTGFIKSRTPRVFQTYMGSNQDISTLAHELGHAYHSWVIRDLSVYEQDYPMTLAETASIFAETVLTDEMIATASSKSQKLDFAWADIESAVALLLNIPARFEFEKSFYQRRKEGTLSPRELSELTDQAWTKWYGDTLSANDTMFWATKAHFSIAGLSFYNFPYTFGYLFALSIYARRKELGSEFWPKYTAILRDTGRMRAEDLVQKHLGEDIRRPEYWQKAISVVKTKLRNFESLI